MNHPKTHNLDNLVLIDKNKNKIRRNSGVINIYTFLHADFEGVEFYAVRRSFHLTKEGIEEELFVSDEEEEYNEVMPVSELPLLVE